MAQKGIREFDGKRLLAEAWPNYFSGLKPFNNKSVLVGPETDLKSLASQHPWVSNTKLVVKPDQLFGKRGKHKLILLNADLKEALDWIESKRGQEVTLNGVTGTLQYFLIEPFVKHEGEFYVSIKTARDGDEVYFSEAGGVEVEENWEKVKKVTVPIAAASQGLGSRISHPLQLPLRHGENRSSSQSGMTFKGDEKIMHAFILGLCNFFKDYNFAYLEINPFALSDDGVMPLDLVARLDDCAEFKMTEKWGGIDFPPPFGRTPYPAEKFILDLDKTTGASLKLTVLNPKGKIWTLLAGAGASLVYFDAIADAGFGGELANYSEYSGNPSREIVYEYAKKILGMMTEQNPMQARALLIGGGNANFTNILATFGGIGQALEDYQEKLRAAKIAIFIRRGGPNYEAGLKMMEELGKKIGLSVHAYGPDTRMVDVAEMVIEEIEKSPPSSLSS